MVPVKIIECEYTGYLEGDGRLISKKCPESHPRLKLEWARYVLFKEWIEACPECNQIVWFFFVLKTNTVLIILNGAFQNSRAAILESAILFFFENPRFR
jgi:hypothetical protein